MVKKMGSGITFILESELRSILTVPTNLRSLPDYGCRLPRV